MKGVKGEVKVERKKRGERSGERSDREKEGGVREREMRREREIGE